MKPTHKTEKICNAIINVVGSWQAEDDLYNKDIHENMSDYLRQELGDCVDQRDIDILNTQLTRLLRYVTTNTLL